MARDEHQRQLLMPFGQRPAHSKGHARQVAEAAALHGRQERHVGRWCAVVWRLLAMCPGLPVGSRGQARGPSAPLADIEGDHDAFLLPALRDFLAVGMTRNKDLTGLAQSPSGAHYPGAGGV